jgi:hypothetical protein
MPRQTSNPARTSNPDSRLRPPRWRPFCRGILCALNCAPLVRRQPPSGTNRSFVAIGTAEGLTAPTPASTGIETRQVRPTEHTAGQTAREPAHTDRPPDHPGCQPWTRTEPSPCYVAS